MYNSMIMCLELFAGTGNRMLDRNKAEIFVGFFAQILYTATHDVK